MPLSAPASALAAHLDAGGTLWLVSDVHANVPALRACLSQIGADDAVVLMGDLLTYGCQPSQALELIERCLSTHTSALLVGNHDALYRDLLVGDTRYYDMLPDFIRESVDWTLGQIDARWFETELPWAEEVALRDLLVAHANPYAHGDWTYLDSREDYHRAALVVRERGFRLGVFGHVHRPRLFVLTERGEHWDTTLVDGFEVGEPMVATWNVGSLGQQRSRHSAASVGRLRRRGSSFELAHSAIAYDLEAHLDAIRSARLSSATTERLCAYYRAEPSAGGGPA